MQSLRLNPILNTDSYKLTHWWQYPPDTRHIYSYVESRGGMFDETMLAMLQYIVKSNFAGQVFTPDDIEEARRIAHAHFGGHPKSFHYEGFKSLYAKHGGRLPLRIRAVKEGTVVKSLNALITIENTDPEFYWLTNWAETVLLQVWYPITVATLSRAIKQVIGLALVRTGDPSLLPFKLHDFGFRGVSSKESAAIGGAAHLLNFFGTDTLAAIQPTSQQKIRSTAPATASPPRNTPRSPLGAKPRRTRPTRTYWQTALKVSSRASATRMTFTTLSAISGAARFATRFSSARAL
jgi:nicotinamide phosphoribosyltransferase